MTADPERDAVIRLYTVFDRFPAWVTVVAFLLLAVGFGLAGTLDDWLRAMCAVAFVALAAANLHKLGAVRAKRAPAPPPTAPLTPPEPPQESPGQSSAPS